MNELNEFSRIELLIGEQNLEHLKRSSVIVFGVGGVGSYCVEALARSGIGRLAVVDNDSVTITNINRQLVAGFKTLGLRKTDVEKERILDVNPNCNVETFDIFYTPDNIGKINLSNYDYIVDAIDTVTSKIYLVEQAQKLNIPIISCMGTGNKLDPTKLIVTDIYKTETCPLARVMRRELRARGIPKLDVVYSTEKPIHPAATSIPTQEEQKQQTTRRRLTPGSVAFVPSVAGLILASVVVRSCLKGTQPTVNL